MKWLHQSNSDPKRQESHACHASQSGAKLSIPCFSAYFLSSKQALMKPEVAYHSQHLQHAFRDVCVVQDVAPQIMGFLMHPYVYHIYHFPTRAFEFLLGFGVPPCTYFRDGEDSGPAGATRFSATEKEHRSDTIRHNIIEPFKLLQVTCSDTYIF